MKYNTRLEHNIITLILCCTYVKNVGRLEGEGGSETEEEILVSLTSLWATVSLTCNRNGNISYETNYIRHLNLSESKEVHS